MANPAAHTAEAQARTARRTSRTSRRRRSFAAMHDATILARSHVGVCNHRADRAFNHSDRLSPPRFAFGGILSVMAHPPAPDSPCVSPIHLLYAVSALCLRSARLRSGHAPPRFLKHSFGGRGSAGFVPPVSRHSTALLVLPRCSRWRVLPSMFRPSHSQKASVGVSLGLTGSSRGGQCSAVAPTVAPLVKPYSHGPSGCLAPCLAPECASVL